MLRFDAAIRRRACVVTQALGRDHKIQKFDQCDFSRIREHLDKEKLIKKAATNDEKAQSKEEKMDMQFRFGCVDVLLRG